MSKLNKIMLMLIAMLAIMILAVGIDRGYDYWQDLKWEKERVQIYEEAKADIETMQAKIETLSSNPEELMAYIEENELHYVELERSMAGMQETQEQNAAEDAAQSIAEDVAQDTAEDTVQSTAEDAMPVFSEQEEAGMGAFVAWADESYLHQVSENSASGNAIAEDGTVSDNSIPDDNISGNMGHDDDTVSDNSVSGNMGYGDGTVSANSVSGNPVSGNSVSFNSSGQPMQICASYEETIRTNQADRAVIAAGTIDFSDKKIACLGDSITEAANLIGKEDYEQSTYPYFLSEILGAKEVVNLGIGGSSIGRYWENAFVDRYKEIPPDTDLILILGGSNDGFCVSDKELGTLTDKKAGTFAGDLDELLKGVKTEYPQADVILITPPSNVLHDMLKKERPYLLSQSVLIEMMLQIAQENEVPVIDLYHDNLLNTHDAAVIHNFMPDGVHGNAAGYRILAEHIAAKVIMFYESKNE